jgi:hypothetical protein
MKIAIFNFLGKLLPGGGIDGIEGIEGIDEKGYCNSLLMR